MTINSADATPISDAACKWLGDYYACLVTHTINLCISNGYIENGTLNEGTFKSNHGDELIGLCENQIGTCASAHDTACDYVNTYGKDTILTHSINLGLSYAFDIYYDSGVAGAAQRDIEMQIMSELIQTNMCACDWNTEYIYPRATFGGDITCAECPDGGTPEINGYGFAAGVQTCIKNGNVPFSDTTGSGYQAGPCPYVTSNGEWAPL